MKTLDQDKLDQILFAVRVLCDCKDDVEGLLKVSFPLFYTDELDFGGSLVKMVEIYRDHYERSGAYSIPNENTELAVMEDLQSLDPEFRVFILEKIFNLNNLAMGDRNQLESLFALKQKEIEKLYNEKVEAFFLRNWQRDLVRPAKNSLLFTVGPISIVLIAIVYLILRGVI